MPETTATAEVVEVLPKLEAMSEKDRTAFLKTGDLPGRTSDDGVKAVESGAAPDAAVQEPAKEEPKRETRAERRIHTLTDRIKQLEAQALARGTERPSESAAVTSTAPVFKTFSEQIGKKYPDWESAHDAWETALHAHYGNLSKQSIADLLKTEREGADKAKAEEDVKKTTDTNAKEFAKRADAFRKTLKEDTFQQSFKDVLETVNEAMALRPEIAELADILVESEVGPQLVHYYGQNPEEFDALLEMPINRALRALGKLEMSDKIKAPIPKTTTAARRIGSEVRGNAATSSDPEEEAVKSGDVLAYIKAANAREAAERTR